MTKRKCFFSFHYSADNWRASTVRNIGAVEGNRPATDNKWEDVKKDGDSGIEKWIAAEMLGKSCIVVLVGTETAGRKWIEHEIVTGWNEGKGVVGIYIHGLKDSNGNCSTKGQNPFDLVYFESGEKLSSMVNCYDPPGIDSQRKYDWIKQNLADLVEEAIRNRR